MRKKSNQKLKGRVPYMLGMVGGTASYIVMSNLTYALTESFGMTAKIVGMIFLISRIFDGITDLIAGVIIDRTKTKLGKARPFEVFYIPLWIAVILCFSVPAQLGMTGKIIWVFVTYNLSQSVFYTFITCIESVRLRRSFEESARVKVVSVAYVGAFVAGLLVSISMPILISIFENMAHGWSIITLIYAVPFMICGMIRLIFLKELDVEEPEITQKREKVSVLAYVKALFQNPYAFIIAGMVLLMGVSSSLSSALNYYFKYVFGDIALASLPGLFSVLAVAANFILPKISEKLGTKKIFMLAFILYAAGGFLRYLTPASLVMFVVTQLILSNATMYVNSMKHVALTETMVYGEWKSKQNFEAIYASVSGMADKLGMGLGSVAIGFILDLGGYDGALAVQSASAITSIKFLNAGIHGVIGIVGFVLALLYTLEKKLPAIRGELAEK